MLLNTELLSKNPVIFMYSNISGCNVWRYVEHLGNVLSKTSDTKIFIVKADQFSAHNASDNGVYLVWSETPVDIGSLSSGSERTIIEVVLTCTPLTGVLRTMVSGGASLATIMTGEHTEELVQRLPDQAGQAENYESIRTSRPDSANRIEIDTTIYAVHEIVGLLGVESQGRNAILEDNSYYEGMALSETISSLEAVGSKLRYKIFYQNVETFEYNLQTLRRLLGLIQNMYVPEAVDELSKEIKERLVDCWYGLTPMVMSRFSINADGTTGVDRTSHAWTPPHYKLSAAEPILKSLMKDKNILDPFAGASVMLSYLAASGIIDKATGSDIAYRGGRSIDGDSTYDPWLNNEMLRFPFDNLSSRHKPSTRKIEDFVTADATALPFDDNQFDYIVTDPPYGISFNEDINTFLESMPELLRVAKLGVIGLVPVSWSEKFDTSLYEVKTLTGELCKGNPTIQTQYVLVKDR
jgi:hypothetical protein